MSLVNITPSVDWSIDCGDEYCDGYCDIHAEYSRKGCDVVGCDSSVSSNLVVLDDEQMSICQYHYSVLN